MTKPNDTLVTFHTTHDALAAERRLLDKLPPVRLVATPRAISSECGFALLCPSRLPAKVEAALRDAELDWEAIYGVRKQGPRRDYLKHEN